MGVYDTLIDEEWQVQVKCFTNELKSYEVGDEVPQKGSYIIVLSVRADAKYAFVKDGIFVGLSRSPPYFIDKWGNFLESPGEFIDLAQKAVDDLGEIENEVESNER